MASLLLFCSLGAHAEVQVLTSIKPLQLIAAAVQEGVGQPQVLLPAGASAHHYALRPSDVRRLRQAELFYWIGPEMEGFLLKPLASREQPSLALQDLSGLQLRHFDAHTSEQATHSAAHEHEHEHDHEHRPGSLDAHLWLLPANAQRIAQRMSQDLARLDPDHAVRYQTNLASFTLRLKALDQRLKQQLQPLQGKPYFVFHEAFDYFEDAYGLRHLGVFSLSEGVQPGVRQVSAMRQRLQQAGSSCVFSEPPLQPRLAQTLAADLPVTLAELDALGSNVAVSAQGYEQLLQNLADGLSTCLKPL
jgi:zinc transport system substrate-binding protein